MADKSVALFYPAHQGWWLTVLGLTLGSIPRSDDCGFGSRFQAKNGHESCT